MLCSHPITLTYGSSVPCGQCLPCRINKVRKWAGRITMESLCHEASLFATLTYDWANCPGDAGGCGLTLRPRDATLFLKRLRERRQKPFRYYLVGEYGSDPREDRKRWPEWMHEAHQPRPHYHLVLFGDFHISETVVTGIRRNGEPRLDHPDVHRAWGLGHTEVGELTPNRCQYVAGYVTKKMTRKEDERTAAWLNGRHPEFARMSRRPGIAVPYVERLADRLDRDGAPYVPRTWFHRGRWWPLDPLIVEKVCNAIGKAPAPLEQGDDAMVPRLDWHGAYGVGEAWIPARQARALDAERKAERLRQRRSKSRVH